MGLAVVNDHIFVSRGFRILELIDKNKDGKADEKRVVFTLPGGPKARHEFLFGMLYRAGKFYVNASVAKCCGDDGQKNPWRGTTLEVDSATGKFTVLAVRSLGPTTMEIEFTEPLAAGAEAAANFAVDTWHYVATSAYGGPDLDKRKLNVGKVTLSADRRRASLEIAGMSEKYLVHFRLGAGIKNAAGQGIWQNEVWYTLNAFGPGTPIPTGLGSGMPRPRTSERSPVFQVRAGLWSVPLGNKGPSRSLSRDAAGRLHVSPAAIGP